MPYTYPDVKNPRIVTAKDAMKVILPFLELASMTRNFDDEVWAANTSTNPDREYKITYGELREIVEKFKKSR